MRIVLNRDVYVRPILEIQNSKRRVFTRLFFYLYEKKFDEHFDECLMNKIRDKKLNVIVDGSSDCTQILTLMSFAYNVS